MKQYFIKGLLVAGIAGCTLPALAQNAKSGTKEKDHQTIVINREAGDDEKTVIEIKGDKVTINGKDAKDVAGVNVNVHKIKTGAHGLSLSGNGRDNWNFNFDNDRISLFSEDSNRAMLGVVTDESDKGAEITSVSKESAAEKAGLKKGDIITKIGDRKIEDAEDVTEAVRSHKPGDKVSISILRDGKEQKLNAELARWKGLKMSSYSPTRVFERMPNVNIDAIAPEVRGFSFDMGRPKLGLSIQDTDEGKGVKVLEVDEDGNAAKAGIKEDDVITHLNEKEVNSADEISKMMRENRDKASVKMQVQRGGKTQNIEVRIPRKLKTADL
ncbi:MAG TPA: PDZ domain-containing protein [Flavisolibacter sp.]